GYLEVDSTGNLQYISLVNKIPEKYRNFDDVWKIHDTEDGIVFQTNRALYIFKDNQFKVIEAKTWFHTSFYVNKVVYVRQHGIGLMELKNEVLELIPGGEEFANQADREIYAMLPYGPDKSLIINNLGTYIYDGKSYKSLKVFPEYFPVKCSALLQNGNYAIGTIQNGMFVIDREGNILQHIDKTKGISNNAVLSMLQDQQGNLWLGLENGISYVETNSPFIFFNDKLNINGSVVYTLLEKDKLYVGTNQGLYFTNWNQKTSSLDPHANFTFVKETYGEVRGLFKIDDKLICGHHDGAFLIKNGVAEKFSSEAGGWIFKKLSHHPYILEGTYFGLFLYESKNGKLIQKNKIKGFKESARYMEEDEDGNIWISHANKGIWKIRLNDQSDSIAQIDFYDDKKGLPSHIRNRVSKIGNEIVVTTDKGIYRYNKTSDNFYEDRILTGLTGRTFVKGIFPDKKENIWFIAEELNNKAGKKPMEAGVLKLQIDGSYKLGKIPFSKFNEIDLEYIESINEGDTVLSAEEGILFSTPEGVINYDPHFSNKINNSFFTLLRKVEDINHQDSLIFNGAFFDINKIASTVQSMAYNFRYISNALRFNVSSNQYENIEKIEYQYFMEGFDKRWSAWTKKTQKEYTNLPEGEYIFHSRAKNIHNKLGQEATFRFTIYPPWYRTYWAYSLYVLLAFLFIWTTIKLYTIKLQNIIENRTKEINQKNIDLELKKKEIESKSIILEENNKKLFELN
ncbi:MAG TPA: two-component regulator propeller domain-containing protein, partial [Cytophagaceae bacterium]|nr:two-component regulator propeller domain-containing protein [Cytophagaceae bacterium]